MVAVSGLLAGAVLQAAALRLVIAAPTDRLPSTAAALRWTFCVYVAGALVYLAWLQPFRGLYAEIALAGCASALGLLTMMRLGRRTPTARRWRHLDLLAFNACVIVVGGELGLRTLATTYPLPVFARTNTDMVERARMYRFRPGRLHLGFPANATGHYDRDFVPAHQRAKPTAVMIGDSFSAGVVPHHHHFTTVAERELGEVDVYNMGVSATGPSYYLHLLRNEAVPLRPDVIAVNIFVGNDLFDIQTPRQREHWLRALLDRDHALLWLVPQRVLRLWGVRGTDAAPTDESDSTGVRLSTLAEIDAAYPAVNDYRRELPLRTTEAFLQIEAERAGYNCAPGITPEPLFGVLRDMRAAADPIPFVVVIIPDEYQVEDILWQQILDRHRGPQLERDVAQRVLTGFLHKEGIPHLDLLPALRAVPVEPDGRRHCYLALDTHFNARGNRAAGEAIAAFLRPYLRR